MTINAIVLADSTSDYGRITTLQLRYPRFVHAEFLTHRALSRNASSSRAIPVERLIADVERDPAMPIHWGKNQKGMQAREEHSAPVVFRNDSVSPEAAWLRARDTAVQAARRFANAGYHKQIVNRLLEPFAHINVVVTATDWDNFFDLRLHPDAQPEIHALAKAMLDAIENSVPRFLNEGEWHLPYVTDEDRAVSFVDLTNQRLISAARCARVSYLTHDQRKPDVLADLRLANQLIDERHASPLEHQAAPRPGRHANLNGWRSFRTEMGL